MLSVLGHHGHPVIISVINVIVLFCVPVCLFLLCYYLLAVRLSYQSYSLPVQPVNLCREVKAIDILYYNPLIMCSVCQFKHKHAIDSWLYTFSGLLENIIVGFTDTGNVVYLQILFHLLGAPRNNRVRHDFIPFSRIPISRAPLSRVL